MTTCDPSRLIAGLIKGRGLATSAAAAGLAAAARTVVEAARAKAPVRSGTLADSGYVGPVAINGPVISVEVGFSAPYAAEVEEDMDASHPGGGQAKFFSGGINESLPAIGPIVAANVRGALS